MRMLSSLLVLGALLSGCDSGDVRRVEVALDQGAATECAGDRLPARGNGSTVQCCQAGDQSWHTTTTGRLVHRVYGTACRNDNGTVGCGVGGPPCVYGPCGAKNLSNLAGPATVFHPSSDPSVCGWHVGDSYDPEPFDGTQEVYAGVTHTCPYNVCLTDGTPVPSALLVAGVTAGGTGHVRSSTGGTKLVGADTMTLAFEGPTPVVLTAQPRGDHARAVFSRDCVATGAYGKKVDCMLTTIAGALAVTVTYECEPGHSC
jgi:hypothetical protein